MRAMRTLGMVMILAAAGCAARVPRQTAFDPSAWRAVEALKPGTPVEIKYVSSERPPLSYSFNGTVLSASVDIVEVQTAAGEQHLLPGNVRRVSVVESRSNTGGRGALVGALVGFSIGLPFVKAISEQHYVDGQHVMAASLCAAVGAGIGALVHRRTPGQAKRTIYERD